MDASKWYSTPLHKLQDKLPKQITRLSINRYIGSKKAVAGARTLGWASIGLGLFEIAAPQAAQQALGLDVRPQRNGIMRVLGARELMHGLGILSENTANRKLAVGIESRVLGDVLDMTLLGVAATKTRRPTKFMAVVAVISAIGYFDFVHAKKLRKLAE